MKNNKDKPTLQQNINPVTRAIAEEKLSSQQKNLVRVVREESIGPIPTPDFLRQYNEICPGAADRIITMAEKEQQHAHNCDRWSFSLTSRAQWISSGLILVFFIFGFLLIWNDKPISGWCAIVTGFSWIGGGYLSRRSNKSNKKSESESKEKGSTKPT